MDVMDMDEEEDEGENGGGSSSPALVMVRRHKTVDSATIAEAMAAKVSWSHRDGSTAGSSDSMEFEEWESEVLDLEDPTAVAEALVARVEMHPANPTVEDARMSLIIERDTLLLVHHCAVAGAELQCIHNVLDVLQARARVYARFGHAQLLEKFALSLALTDDAQPILTIYVEDPKFLQAVIDLAAGDTATATATGAQQQKEQASSKAYQTLQLQAALLRFLKQRPSQFGSAILTVHRRVLPARRREFAEFLFQQADGKMHELVRARRLHSPDAKLQAEMAQTVATAQRLFGEAATLYGEEGCYRASQRCTCLAALVEHQQQNPDLELLEGLDKAGSAAAAQALRSNLRSLGDVATYQLLAVAHGFEPQLEEAWPDLVYEHAVLRNSLDFFAEFLRRVHTERLTVFYEALARRHYLAATTERHSADEESFQGFIDQLEGAGMHEAHRRLRAAAADTKRVLQLP
jgi:hypothetical protein